MKQTNKHRISIYILEEVAVKFKKRAFAEKRGLSNMMEVILEDYLDISNEKNRK